MKMFLFIVLLLNFDALADTAPQKVHACIFETTKIFGIVEKIAGEVVPAVNGLKAVFISDERGNFRNAQEIELHKSWPTTDGGMFVYLDGPFKGQNNWYPHEVVTLSRASDKWIERKVPSGFILKIDENGREALLEEHSFLLRKRVGSIKGICAPCESNDSENCSFYPL